tara:strand:- start:268 stop:819 length:552 start_codon:yes stop_codon:yes gene_type:complete
MLKKIIIVILIIVGYKFFVDSKNLIERCSDHSYLRYSVKANIADFAEPIKKSDLLGKIVDGDDYEKGLATEKEYHYFEAHRNLILIEDKSINRTFEYLNQSFLKKKEINNYYQKISLRCQYESNYNPKTFNKTWENAMIFNELKKMIIKARKKNKNLINNVNPFSVKLQINVEEAEDIEKDKE